MMEYISKNLDINEKIKLADKLVNKEIKEDVLNNSILFIGPMATGKSTISREVSKKTNMPVVSLDDRGFLKEFYQNENKFENFKDFEFYLTVSVLTSLNESSIIDFGAGHSVYENELVFEEFKKVVNQFKNIFLIMPSSDKEESIHILNERLSKRKEKIDQHVFDTNKHFIYENCNYEIATNCIYTKSMMIDEVVNDVLNEINSKKNKIEF